MMGSTISSTSAAITALPPNTEPPGPKPFRPGPRSPAWPLWHSGQCALPVPHASSQPEPIKLTVPNSQRRARSQVEQQWGQFSAAAKSRCTQVSTLGVAPSYVELLTCLENARDTNLDADRAPVTTTPPPRRP